MAIRKKNERRQRMRQRKGKDNVRSSDMTCRNRVDNYSGGCFACAQRDQREKQLGATMGWGVGGEGGWHPVLQPFESFSRFVKEESSLVERMGGRRLLSLDKHIRLEIKRRNQGQKSMLIRGLGDFWLEKRQCGENEGDGTCETKGVRFSCPFSVYKYNKTRYGSRK